MTRGKHGASATARRLAEAEEQINTLRVVADSVRAAHSEEVQHLRAELQNLRGTFSTQVKEVANAAILAAKEDARAQVAATEAKADQRMRDALRFIFTNANDFSMRSAASGGSGDWAELSQIAGIPLGEMIALDPKITANNKMRRATARSANLMADIRRSPAGFGD